MKQRVIFIEKGIRAYRDIKAKVKKGKMFFPKGLQETPVELHDACILDEDKPRYAFWRPKRRLIVHIQGNVKPLRFYPQEKIVDMGFLNIDDIVKAVKTEVVKALTQFKPIKLNYFLILCFIGIVNLGIAGMIARRLGALFMGAI